MNKKWFKHCVMFFSFKERRARKLARYRQRVSEIENMESDEKDFEYITLKTDYEHKKRALTIFAIFLVLVILPNVWKYFFLYIEKGLQCAASVKGSEIEIIKVSFAIIIITAVAITFLFVFILAVSMKEINRMQKELMTVETVRDKQSLSS